MVILRRGKGLNFSKKLTSENKFFDSPPQKNQIIILWLGECKKNRFKYSSNGFEAQPGALFSFNPRVRITNFETDIFRWKIISEEKTVIVRSGELQPWMLHVLIIFMTLSVKWNWWELKSKICTLTHQRQHII
jgi:hypothetical protein